MYMAMLFFFRMESHGPKKLKKKVYRAIEDTKDKFQFFSQLFEEMNNNVMLYHLSLFFLQKNQQ